MLLKIHMVIVVIMLIGLGSTIVFSFKRCGWGMFAYENAFIAALTKECAQQQRELLLKEQLLMAPARP